MAILNSDTDTFWLFGAFALILAHITKTAFSDLFFVQGYGTILSLPVDIIHAIFGSAPILMPIGVILVSLYFSTVVREIGEGYAFFAIMAFLAVMIGVGTI